MAVVVMWWVGLGLEGAQEGKGVAGKAHGDSFVNKGPKRGPPEPGSGRRCQVMSGCSC